MIGQLRAATASDAAAILAIYSPYITRTTITFETQIPTEQAYAGRIGDILAHFPFLVWESAGQIMGYAYAHRFAARAAYDWAAECSVYLAPEAQGTGIAHCLYSALIDLLKAMNYVHLYSLITYPNERSERFHKSVGFKLVAYLPSVGYTLDRWIDLAYYHLELVALPPKPLPTIAFRSLPVAQVHRILTDRSHIDHETASR